MNLHTVIGNVKGYIGHMQKIIGKILLDDITLIAAANNELINTVGGIYLHDMPEYRLAADLYHRLWLQMSFFTYTRAETTGKDDSLHNIISPHIKLWPDFALHVVDVPKCLSAQPSYFLMPLLLDFQIKELVLDREYKA